MVAAPAREVKRAVFACKTTGQMLISVLRHAGARIVKRCGAAWDGRPAAHDSGHRKTADQSTPSALVTDRVLVRDDRSSLLLEDELSHATALLCAGHHCERLHPANIFDAAGIYDCEIAPSDLTVWELRDRSDNGAARNAERSTRGNDALEPYDDEGWCRWRGAWPCDERVRSGLDHRTWRCGHKYGERKNATHLNHLSREPTGAANVVWHAQEHTHSRYEARDY